LSLTNASTAITAFDDQALQTTQSCAGNKRTNAVAANANARDIISTLARVSKCQQNGHCLTAQL